MPIPQLNKRTYGYGGPKRAPKSEPPRKNRSRRPKKRRPSGSFSLWSIIGRYKRQFFTSILTLAVIGFLMITILFAWASKDLPDPDKLTDRQVAQSTKIYDKTGEHLLYEIFADERRTVVELDDIPENLINGLIATEDTKFYTHKGIRPLSIIRSIVTGVFTSKRVGSGASTLTQQLVKNAILTSERSYTRKLKEVILTIRLEQKYSKEQILKIYFNEIPYGSTNYGVESASQSYFGKSVRDLTLAESATLAGFPKAPSRYLNNTDALKDRRDFVLSRMFAEGYISEEEKNAAQAEQMEIKQTFHNIEAPHFVLYVKEKLVEEFGEATVETGGLKVVTSLDWDMQQAAQAAVDEEGTTALENAGANNTSLVAIDPNTGHILAMIGSKDFFDDDIDGQFNVATLGRRQPGSSFKPIVYAAAFEKGYTADTILYDAETNFSSSGKPYTPRNYDLQEHGPMTIRYALGGSLNIPAVKALYLVGPQKGVEFAERLGYSTLSDGDFGLSLVLGGGEVTLLDHVHAYTAFANEGVQHSVTSILRVEDSTGEILSEWNAESGKKVIDREVANLMTDVLSDNDARAWAFGANNILTLSGRPVAAKTGTTNSYIDAWIVGYTPSLVAGVWSGNTDNTPMNRGFGGSRVSGPIWNKFMREALKNTPVEAFPAPPENDAQKPVLRGQNNGEIVLDVDKVTGKRASSSTPSEYIEKRIYIQPHSILHYVDKDDPRGNVPENPERDPQYSAWEQAVQRWVEGKIKKLEEEGNTVSVSFEDPPTEFDTEEDLGLIPTLEIVYPAQGQTIDVEGIFQTDIRATAPRGVTQVTYMIDGVYVDVIKSHPFNLSYTKELLPGAHTLTVIVEDDIGNRLEKEVTFAVSGTPVPAQLSFSYDYPNIGIQEFPYTFIVDYYKIDDIAGADLVVDGQVVQSYTSFEKNTLDETSILMWNNPPSPGTHTIGIVVHNKDGSSYQTDQKTTTAIQ